MPRGGARHRRSRSPHQRLVPGHPQGGGITSRPNRRNGTVIPEATGAAQLSDFFAASAYKSNLSTIKRSYYYSYRSNGPGEEDPGLVEPDGNTRRQIYCVYKAKTRPGVAW